MYARSDVLLWVGIAFLGTVLVAATVLSVLAYLREMDSSQTFSNLDVGNNLTVGGGLPVHFQTFGTVAVGTATSNTVTMPVTFATTPSSTPVVLATAAQSSATYPNLSITVSSVSTNGFNIIASLPGASDEFTEPFTVNWMAMS